MYLETGHLAPCPPFDFGRSLDFLGIFAPTQTEQTLATRSLTKAVTIRGQAVAFQVTDGGQWHRAVVRRVHPHPQPGANGTGVCWG